MFTNIFHTVYFPSWELLQVLITVVKSSCHYHGLDAIEKLRWNPLHLKLEITITLGCLVQLYAMFMYKSPTMLYQEDTLYIKKKILAIKSRTQTREIDARQDNC